MSDEVKDNLQSEASNETPSNQETPNVTSESVPAEAAPATTEAKMYAGKFKTAEDLEKSYKELESKVGQKGYAESLGQRVVEATGYSVTDLESAGYTPEQIVQAVVSWQDNGKQTEMTKASPKEEISQRVEDSRYEKLEWEMKLRDFFSENPEAKQFKEEMNDFHSMSQYKGMDPQDLFGSKLSKFVTKGEENVQARQSEKEKASLSISNAAPPVVDETMIHATKFRSEGRLEDAGKFIAGRLFGKKK